MNKKSLISIVIVLVTVVVVGVFIMLEKNVETPVGTPTPTPTPIPTQTSPVLSPAPTRSEVFVTYLDSGYSPAILKIKKGDIITFKNSSSKMMWIASVLHPTHKIYPGSDIAKCGTESQAGIFDACRGYNSGESWMFKFDQLGTWKYHNHLQANHAGTIVVE